MAASGSSTSTVPVAKTRVVYRKTVEKWITGNDDINASVWLKFEADRQGHVLSLKCSVCNQFKDKLVGMRNYRAAFVDGTTNVRLSTVKDHAATDMQAHAMQLLRKKVWKSRYGVLTDCCSFTSLYDGPYGSRDIEEEI